MFRRIPSTRLLSIDAKRICIIKPSAFGDVVQTLPLLPVLRERFPEAKLSWVINRELRDLLSENPCLDEIIPFERHGSWKSWVNTLHRLRQAQFDLVFDLQGLLRTAVMTACTRAPVRVGLQNAREGGQCAVNCTLPETRQDVPAHAIYWRVAESLGMGNREREAVVQYSEQDDLWTRQQFAGLRRPILAVHPGARWATKRWPVEKYSVLCARAVRQYGCSLVLVGSGAEVPVAEELTCWLRAIHSDATILDLTGKTSLKQLAAVLSCSDALLTNDSGPMHLAAALGTPVLGVFTCTSPQRSGPPGPLHELVATQVGCAASYKKQCPLRGSQNMACMSELTVDRVNAALVRLLEKNRIAKRAA